MYRTNLASVLATLFAICSFAQSADIPGLPSCVQPCITTSFGDCSQVDVKCICSNKDLVSNLGCCVSKHCDQVDVQAIVSFADALCGSYGVNDLPRNATCAPDSSSNKTESATATPTEPASSTAIDTANDTANGTANDTAAAPAASATSPTTAAAVANYQPQSAGLVVAVFALLAAAAAVAL